MNTAPQDDFSGDLARDLGGWSDDALLKELSRRTTITTDADHELISTGAGLHLQHRNISATSPIKVTYTPASGAAAAFFTIAVEGMRWAFDSAGMHSEVATDPSHQGVFPTVSWDFNDGASDTWIEIGYTATYSVINHEHKTASYTLSFTDPDARATDTTDKTDLDTTGAWKRLARIRLERLGGYEIESDIKYPHVILRNGLATDHTELEWDSVAGELKVYNVGDEAQGKLSFYLAIPSPSGERIVCMGNDRSGALTLGFHDDEWLSDPLRICRLEIDTGNALQWIRPYNQRLHNRPWSSQIVVCKIESHVAGEKTATVSIWLGGYYDDAVSKTVNTPDATGMSAHVLQLNDTRTLIAGRLHLGRWVYGGAIEILPWTLQ